MSMWRPAPDVDGSPGAQITARPRRRPWVVPAAVLAVLGVGLGLVRSCWTPIVPPRERSTRPDGAESGSGPALRGAGGGGRDAHVVPDVAGAHDDGEVADATLDRTVAELLGDDGDRGEAALDLLVRSNGPTLARALDLIEGQWPNPGDAARRRGLRLIGQSGVSEGVAGDLLAAGLRDESEWVQLEACRAAITRAWVPDDVERVLLGLIQRATVQKLVGIAVLERLRYELDENVAVTCLDGVARSPTRDGLYAAPKIVASVTQAGLPLAQSIGSLAVVAHRVEGLFQLLDACRKSSAVPFEAWLAAVRASTGEARSACVYLASMRAGDEPSLVRVIDQVWMHDGDPGVVQAGRAAALLRSGVSQQTWRDAMGILDGPFGSFSEALLEHALRRMTFVSPWIGGDALQRLSRSAHMTNVESALKSRIAALPVVEREEVLVSGVREIGTERGRMVVLDLLLESWWKGPYSATARRLVADALGDRSELVVLGALRTVSSSEELAGGLGEAVIALWPARSAAVRRQILRVLESAGREAEKIQAILREAAVDEDEDVRKAAGRIQMAPESPR